MNQRELFLRHVAQTSPAPLAIEVVRADCATLYDAAGKEYIDLIGGISVANIGHRHPKVVEAIRAQTDAYLHVMVYGEMIESPQVRYATALAKQLPSTLQSVYFTNSGTEATEGAIKLAKRVTGRTKMIAFNQAYHGSTQGALSLLGDEYFRNAFRPLLPGISHFDINTEAAVDAIDGQTACVIIETIQAESGIIIPAKNWMKALRKKCSDTGTLLIFDEIQAGFGRTGSLWGFIRYDVIPDILLLGKALGGGMPLGAFISDKKWMDQLTDRPVLGHITTFGGHPVCCAAGLAAFEALLEEKWIEQVFEKEQLLLAALVHPKIVSVRSAGLWMGVEFASAEACKKVIDYVLGKGLLTDWFLFAPHCLRISPPLIIHPEQLKKAAALIIEACDVVLAQ
ncbi:MAG: aspartate aminotransferase family protein [Sphingomonadales bacterium]|nr:aspartate aminotransferase family protein [Sphingomonadales bacterium]